jgi:hypothetical protein
VEELCADTTLQPLLTQLQTVDCPFNPIRDVMTPAPAATP